MNFPFNVCSSVCVCGLEVELCRAPAATISFHPHHTHNTLLMVPSWVTWLWVCLIGSESVGYRPRSRRLIAADCAFQRLMGLWTRVGNYCYVELLIIYSGVFTRVLCTTQQSMTVALWIAWGDLRLWIRDGGQEAGADWEKASDWIFTEVKDVLHLQRSMQSL